MPNERIQILTKLQFTLVKLREHFKNLSKNTPYTEFEDKQYMDFSFADMFMLYPRYHSKKNIDIVEIV